MAIDARHEHDPDVSRLYKAHAREEPPRHLDNAIRAAARRAVHARPHPLGAWVRRWRTPMSIAAVVVLSVSLVMLLRDHGMDRLDLPAATEQTPERPAGEPPSQAEDKASAAPAPRAVAPPVKEPPDTPAASGPAPSGPAGDKARSRAATQAPPAPRSDAPRTADPAFRARPEAEPAPTAPFPAKAPRDAAPRQSDGERAKRAEEAATGHAVTAPPVVTAPEATDATRSERSASRALAAARPAPRAVAPAWAGLESAPPEEWTKRMHELRAAGKAAEADEILSEFRKRFPDHPLARAGQASPFPEQ